MSGVHLALLVAVCKPQLGSNQPRCMAKSGQAPPLTACAHSSMDNLSRRDSRMPVMSAQYLNPHCHHDDAVVMMLSGPSDQGRRAQTMESVTGPLCADELALVAPSLQGTGKGDREWSLFQLLCQHYVPWRCPPPHLLA
jgi:hypothetical protein